MAERKQEFVSSEYEPPQLVDLGPVGAETLGGCGGTFDGACSAASGINLF